MSFRRDHPALRWLASNLPTPLLTVLRYRKEFLHAHGLALTRTTRPSVAFFTVRKCASTMMRRLLAEIATRHLGITPVNLVAYLWDTSSVPDIYAHLNTNRLGLFRDNGFLYAPLRRPVDLGHLPAVRTLAMLRDPRDVVVSAYYSARYSHRPPANRSRRAGFDERRLAAAEMSFDDWVRQEAQQTSQVYADFREQLARESVVTYEDMWQDFDSWLRQVERILELQLTAPDRARLKAIADIQPGSTEIPQAHRRQGAPGDFRHKLSAELAQELTALFEPELQWLYHR